MQPQNRLRRWDFVHSFYPSVLTGEAGRRQETRQPQQYCLLVKIEGFEISQGWGQIWVLTSQLCDLHLRAREKVKHMKFNMPNGRRCPLIFKVNPARACPTLVSILLYLVGPQFSHL